MTRSLISLAASIAALTFAADAHAECKVRACAALADETLTDYTFVSPNERKPLPRRIALVEKLQTGGFCADAEVAATAPPSCDGIAAAAAAVGLRGYHAQKTVDLLTKAGACQGAGSPCAEPPPACCGVKSCRALADEALTDYTFVSPNRRQPLPARIALVERLQTAGFCAEPGVADRAPPSCDALPATVAMSGYHGQKTVRLLTEAGACVPAGQSCQCP